MAKKLLSSALAAAVACTGCSDNSRGIAGNTYVYEKDGFGGEFGIKLNDNGTFSYYEGALSSYIGSGEWSLGNGVLTLSENRQGRPCEMRFAQDGGDLRFIADGSDNFMYVKAEDGDRFLKKR